METSTQQCPKCNSTHFELRQSGPHHGLYCRDCGKFIRWVKESERPKLEEAIAEKDMTTEPCWACDQDYVIPTGYGDGGITAWQMLEGNYCPECGRKLR